MSDHKNHITNLTPELMQQYQNGSLSTDMQHQVERYLLDHPFETEAMEGMEFMKEADFASDVVNLKSQIKSKEKKIKTIPIWQQYWKVAAVITILVASTFLVLEMNRTSEVTQNELALNDEAESENEQKSKEAASIVKNDDDLVSKTSSDEEVLEEASVNAEYSEELEAEELVAKLTEEVVESDVVADNAVTESILEEVMAEDSVKSDELYKEEASEAQQLALVTRSEKARKSMAASGAPLSNSDKLAGDLESASRTITGRITSIEDGSTLPGVNVVVAGTTKGTITDFDGNYELVIPEGKEVVSYSFIGYQSEEVEIGNRTVLDMSMSADVSALSEVVVTAMGVEREKKALGYAVSEVEKKRSKKRTSAVPLDGFETYENYLKSSLHYPQEAIDNNIEGTVVIRFVVDDNSKLVDFESTKSLGYGCDEEAIRLIKEGPKWQAAINRRGDTVKEKVKIEVLFKK